MPRWPAVLLAGAALFAFARGSLWGGALLVVLAALAWEFWPQLRARRHSARQSAADPEDAAARAILGVGPTASESEIRAAYRTKMRRAHPDRGGAHNEAARLTAARDRLLKR